MAEIISYEDALQLDDNRSLLIGNGFSIAQGGGNFGYANLLATVDLNPDDPLSRLFTDYNTVDFEIVMSALDTASKVEAVYGNDARAAELSDAAEQVRTHLIEAVHEIHPGIQFDIPEGQINACAEFLRKFQNLFSLNYDLLTYWVIQNMRPRNFADGFRTELDYRECLAFDETVEVNTFYLHGALHLFYRNYQTLKRRLTGNTIIEDIARSIRRHKQLPLFVAEGTTEQKLEKIQSNPYLSKCLESLGTISGTIFVFGHGAGDNDEHIYNTIFHSEIRTFVFCVHDLTARRREVEERLAKYEVRRNDVSFYLVDSSEVNPWGHV